ncbi:MAG: methyltransferase domain-containing protein [Nitrososphaeria archaeon]
MTWEETIQHIRTLPEFSELVAKAYLDEDLMFNVQRFAQSEEFEETLRLIKLHVPEAKKVLDIGAGNGISAINFALLGYEVSAVEPDPSDTVGAGAIKKLKEYYHLSNIQIYETFAEEMPFHNASFDVVYARQAMHHATDLNKFVNEAVRVLKPGGLLFTVRDHVIYDEKDKEWFLQEHPLHKYYGGENAYTVEQYRQAIVSAGAVIVKELKYYDSVINYFPLSKKEKEAMHEQYLEKCRLRLREKIGIVAESSFIFALYKWIKGIKPGKVYDEKKVPGRMYSFIAVREG